MTQRRTKRSKAELRARMRRIRASIPEGERAERAGRVGSRVLALPEIRRASTILLFYSFGTEIETRTLFRRLHEDGKRLLLPYLEGREIEVTEVTPGDPMASTAYGAREPHRREPVDPGELDVVIAPGLAFDRRGFRLGYGGGHYDRFLARLEPRTTRVGIGYAEQLLDRIPVARHDQALHVVVTDAEVVDVRTGAGPGRAPL